MDPARAGALGAAIGVPIVLALLRRWLPAAIGAEEAGYSLDQLRKKYRRWELLALPVIFVIAPATGFVWWTILKSVGAVRFSLLGEGTFRLVPGGAVYAFPAMALAIASTFRPGDLLYRWVLGSRYAEFMTYQKLKYGFDSDRFEKVFWIIAAGFSTIFMALALDWYVTFGANEMIINRFWSLTAERYSYSDVRAIHTSSQVEAPNGSIRPKWAFLLEFENGARWSSVSEPADAGPEELQPIASFVSDRAGIRIDAVPFLKRKDL